jgi:hypothetical protein
MPLLDADKFRARLRELLNSPEVISTVQQLQLEAPKKPNDGEGESGALAEGDGTEE